MRLFGNNRSMDASPKNVLVVIPARAGSKRIPGKNIRLFHGKPLLTHAIEQALRVPFASRVVVDTDSPEIAAIAKAAGADVPFLRPPELAQDTSRVVDSILHLLGKLKADEGYAPTHLLLLQTTSPLRTMEDIDACWKMMCDTDATTVLTVCPTHPRFYHLSDANDLILVNGNEGLSTNVQEWKPGYMLNGCFVYIVKTDALIAEKVIITKKTKAVVCPRWRSVDLDTLEDWALAELLYQHKDEIESRIRALEAPKV